MLQNCITFYEIYKNVTSTVHICQTAAFKSDKATDETRKNNFGAFGPYFGGAFLKNIMVLSFGAYGTASIIMLI